MRYTSTLSIIAALVAISNTLADHSFSTINAEVGYDPIVIPLDTSQFTGPLGGFHLSVDWSAPNDPIPSAVPRSAEAVWELAVAGCPVLLAAPGPSPDSTDDSSPVTLTWSGTFPYDFGPYYLEHSPDIELRLRQDHAGTLAIWQNVELTLIDTDSVLPVPPAATDLGTLADGSTAVQESLTPDEVKWYKFRLDAGIIEARGDFLTIHTLGSNLSHATSERDNDTQVGLYNWAGFLVASNDDAEILDGQLLAAMEFGQGQSSLLFNAGDLPIDSCDPYYYEGPEDCYYLAVAGYKTEFGPSNFEVANTSGLTGDLRLTLTTAYPGADCNYNDVDDLIDLLTGDASDFNTNGIPDSCDIAADTSTDCQSNGIPDECEQSKIIFQEDFENGLPPTWSNSGFYSEPSSWHVTDQCQRPNTADSTQWAYVGDDDTCTRLSTNSGILISPPITLPSRGTILLHYDSAYAGTYYYDSNDYDRDYAWLALAKYPREYPYPYTDPDHYVVLATDQVYRYGDQPDWETRQLDLTGLAGQTVQLEFFYHSDHAPYLDHLGWQIDNIRIVQQNQGDSDCNENDVPDQCDIANQDSLDCNLDHVPDECSQPYMIPVFEETFPTYQLDQNKWPGTTVTSVQTPRLSPPRAFQIPYDNYYEHWLESATIDLSGYPWAMLQFAYEVGPAVEFWDGSQWQSLVSRSGLLLSWHQYRGLLPPEAMHSDFRFRLGCRPDYGYSVVDDVIIGVPPTDCNSNSIPDSCDIAQLGAPDCNENLSPDSCDVAAGLADDYDNDGLITECDPDTDGDGVDNEFDVCPESPLDRTTNPVGGPMGDFDDSCDLDLDDYYFLEICLYLSGPNGDPGFTDCTDFFDFDADNDVDLNDFSSFQRDYAQ